MAGAKSSAAGKASKKKGEENAGMNRKRTGGRDGKKSVQDDEEQGKEEEKSEEKEKQSLEEDKKRDKEQKNSVSPNTSKRKQVLKSPAPEGGEKTQVNPATTLTMPPTKDGKEQPGFRAQAIALGPFISDILICFIIGFFFLTVPTYFIEPYRRGYFCGDTSIRYPHIGDSISTAALFFICLGMLLITLIGTEVFRIIKLSESQSATSGKNINRFMIRFLTYFAHGVFGLLLNLAFTQITKWMVGRLRPYFLDVCKSSITFAECPDPNEYRTDYICKGDKALVKEARLSFFSGHSSFCMGTAVFCVIYMQARLPRRLYGIVLLPVLQAFLIGVAFIVGLSRISDNAHHWSDVAVGFLVGCGIGYYSAVVLAKVFERADLTFRREERQPMIESGGQQPADTNLDNVANTRTTYTFPAINPTMSLDPTQMTMATTVAASTAVESPTTVQPSTILLTTEALHAKGSQG